MERREGQGFRNGQEQEERMGNCLSRKVDTVRRPADGHPDARDCLIHHA